MSPQNNPFNITFGKEPKNIIPRDSDFKSIFDSFLNENPDSEIYLLTGPRGSGKTVSLTTISNVFKEFDKWLVINLNPSADMLEQLGSKLYDEGKLKKLFVSVDFNFSFKGLGFSITGKEPIAHISTLLKKEFEYLKKKGIRVLITVDEVYSNDYMKIFTQEFQLFIRENYPVFLLMTGLYQNISLLERQKNLTFLVRAPRIYLGGLNNRSIVNSYKRIFDIKDKNAVELAKLTNGYAFAYQLLGDILYKNNKTRVDQDVIDRYDELLQERSYNLIYNELSDKEKLILHAAATNSDNSYLMKEAEVSSNQLSNYKKGLYLKGIIEKDYRSGISFALPRFKEYLLFIESFWE